jgi:hypothetical protein
VGDEVSTGRSTELGRRAAGEPLDDLRCLVLIAAARLRAVLSFGLRRSSQRIRQ